MDDADRADKRIYTAIQDAIDSAHRAQSLKPTGYCYNCNEAIQTGWLFCCKDCAQDYDHRQARKRVNGL